MKKTSGDTNPADRARYCRTRKRLIVAEFALLATAASSYLLWSFPWGLGTFPVLGPVFSAVEYAFIVVIPLAVVHGLASVVFLLCRSRSRTSYHVASIVIYVLGSVPLFLAVWEDAHSDGFLAGLITWVVLLFVIPCIAVFLIMNIVLLVRERRRIRRGMPESDDRR